jgi:epoxyqueuosine reductase
MWPSASILREMALEAGFELVGIGPVQQADHSERFLRWIELGRHGEMDYLAQNRERIAAPERWRPGLRSGLSVALDYTRGEIRVSDPSGAGGGSAGARVARYAAGRDYHRVIGKRLERLKKRLVADGAPTEGLHYGVDALPFLERALGIGAGVGFLAKSSMLLSPARGPMLLLGELLLGREYPPDAAAHGSCGTCTACLDACPTDAFAGPFELDARRCLSYSSIELRGPVPRELREAQSEWLFGCDICLEVCPFVRHGRANPADPDLAVHPALERYELVGILELSQEQWDRDWCGTAIRRATRNGLRRNAALALGRSENPLAETALQHALLDPDAGVRSSAAWALARLGTGRAALEAALDAEENPALRADLARSLEEFGLSSPDPGPR